MQELRRYGYNLRIDTVNDEVINIYSNRRLPTKVRIKLVNDIRKGNIIIHGIYDNIVLFKYFNSGTNQYRNYIRYLIHDTIRRTYAGGRVNMTINMEIWG